MINKIWDHLDLINAQDAFSFFFLFFMNTFENTFPEKFVHIKYKNKHSWMPNSLIKSIQNHHILYKQSITNPTDTNRKTYTIYNNKLNSIKRKEEREYFSNQLEINKSDMRKSWKIMKFVIGTKRRTNNNKTSFIINNKKIDNALLIANEFTKYFVSVSQALAANLATEYV